MHVCHYNNDRLQRNEQMAMVVAFAAVIIRDYNGFRDEKLENTLDYPITPHGCRRDEEGQRQHFSKTYYLVGSSGIQTYIAWLLSCC